MVNPNGAISSHSNLQRGKADDLGRQRILIIAFSHLDRDPRVLRQILCLRDDYSVRALGLSPSNLSGIENYVFPSAPYSPLCIRRSPANLFRVLLRDINGAYWSTPTMRSAAEFAERIPCDVVLANDVETLPLALHIAARRGASIVLDAHEYSPGQGSGAKDRLLLNPFWASVCRTMLPRVDAMMTVGDGIAEKYRRAFGVQAKVVLNAPSYEELHPSPTDPNKIRLVHHGIVASGRRPELMLDLIQRLDDRFTLDLMLVPSDASCMDRLVHMASAMPRVRFREPVTTDAIARSISEYDIGLFMLPSNTTNHRLALPNKLFEFIQARLALAIWPSPEMAAIVERYGCGVTSNAPTVASLARELNSMTATDIDRYKKHSHSAAASLCSERCASVWLETVETLCRKKGPCNSSFQ